MITDFSSVFFDFAYMKKPLIYFQFDSEKFRKKHYKKGYFSYNDDGFGPVLENSEQVIEEIEQKLKNNLEVEQKYLSRINGFFTVRDSNNCKRTFEAIKQLS